MRVRVRVRLGTPDQQLLRFQRVLLAAGHTDYYAPRLDAARLATPAAVAALRAVEEGLARLPAADLHAFLENRDSFRNRAVRAAPPCDTERVEMAPEGWRHRLGVHPYAIAGSFAALRRLACDIRAGVASIAGTVRRIVVYSRVDRELLGEADREFLWQILELPVFEQVRGLDGELLARECDAHAGLHINEECALVEAPAIGCREELVITSLAGVRYPVLRLRTGLVAHRAPGLCGCGEKSGRLIFSSGIRKLRAMERASFDFGARGSLVR